jgi:hypothetical protein
MNGVRQGRRFGWLAMLVASALPLLAASDQGRAVVVVDLTEAGRKIARPTPEHPAFYVPLVVGYRSEGGQVAGEHPPPLNDVVARQLGKTLAQEGYRVVGPGTGEPSLLLVFSWGTWNPQVDLQAVDDPRESDDPVPSSGQGLLQKKIPSKAADDMLALVAGNTLKNLPSVPDYMTDTKRDAIREDMGEGRYFVVVAAFDWAAAKAHRRVMLWSAKMSIRSTGTWFDEVFPALIASGGPFFGRETHERQDVTVPLAPEGQVELGELKTKEIVVPTTESGSASSEAKP